MVKPYFEISLKADVHDLTHPNFTLMLSGNTNFELSLSVNAKLFICVHCKTHSALVLNAKFKLCIDI